MHAMQKSVTLAGALALALTLGGCGSDTVVNPPPPPPPPPPPVTTVLFSNSGPVPPMSVGYIQFTIPSAGRIDAEVNWTFASSVVAIAMTTASCEDWEAAFAGQCSNIGNPNNNRTQKPKTVSGSVTQGGSGRLWILNLSTVDESMAAQITHTTNAAASAPIALESFARSWVPVPNAAVRAVRLQD